MGHLHGRSLILLGIARTIAVLARHADEPARPVATRRGPALRRGDRFHVEVRVVNEGDHAAEAVQEVAELKVGEETIESEQAVALLAGGAEEDLVFAFDDDPVGRA